MKTLLLSITAKDCEWSYTKGTGAGGQKKNKTSSAVHCMHTPSGAHGFSQDGRSQLHNRQDAFRKMAESIEFQNWIKIESAKRLGIISDIDKIVEDQMKVTNLLFEIKKDGKWVKMEDCDIYG